MNKIIYSNKSYYLTQSEFEAALLCWDKKGSYYCKRTGELLSPFNRSEKLPGTLYLNPTLSTDDFLDNWEKQNILHPQSSDRVNFARAINESSLRICDLPPEFCWIFDISREVYGNRTPIIEHLQASRSFRKSNSQKDITRRQRISEIKNELS